MTDTPESPAPRPPLVAIVMCTYDGERFIEAQLASIAAQTHAAWSLTVSDDGSRDRTLEIVRAFATARAGRNPVRIAEGPRAGTTANFLTALARAPAAPYYAFADQDDVWLSDKLARALAALAGLPEATPALYCGRTRIVDAEGRPIGLSPAFLRPPAFANALVQSLGGGNTMVMNRAARDLLAAAGPDPDIVSHDWWAYQLVSGAGGTVIYDPEPALLYRQHGANQVGDNLGLRARLKRMKMLFQGRFQTWGERNSRALTRASGLLTEASRRQLEGFVEMRRAGFPRNLALLLKLGLYRQTRAGHLGLIVAVILRKV